MTDGAPQGRGEVRRLSSARTDRVRMAGIVLASLFTLGTCAMLVEREALPTLVLFGVSLVLWLRAWVGRRLTVVETDGESLRVSSPSQMIRIPLSEVVSVSRVWWPGAQRIYLEVGRDTPFGREIVFEAPLDLAALTGPHPLVGELRDLMARARRAGQT